MAISLSAAEVIIVTLTCSVSENKGIKSRHLRLSVYSSNIISVMGVIAPTALCLLVVRSLVPL